jgi:C4-dicarboxylate transporter DctQ subunit
LVRVISKTINKTGEIISYLEDNIVMVLLIVLVFLGFIQVFYRYVLELPLPWTEEMMRLAFVWSVFIGCSIGAKRKAHLGVEFIVNLLPKRIQELIFLVIYLLCGIACLYLSYTGLQLSLIKTRLPVTGLPTYIANSALPVGFFLTAIRFFFLAWEKTILLISTNEVKIHTER